MKTILILMLLILNSLAFATDYKVGKKAWKKMQCASCHKKDGSGQAKLDDKGNPKINSIMKGPTICLDEDYMVTQVTNIRDKVRKTKNTIEMQKRAKKHLKSSAAIEDVVKYVREVICKGKASGKGMNIQ